MWASQHASFYLIFWSRSKRELWEPAMLSLAHPVEARARCATVVPLTHSGAAFLLYHCFLPWIPLLPSGPPHQPSGNVWVTHEEMENLAAPAKTVSLYSFVEHAKPLFCCYLDGKAGLYHRIRVMGMFTQWYAMIMV